MRARAFLAVFLGLAMPQVCLAEKTVTWPEAVSRAVADYEYLEPEFIGKRLKKCYEKSNIESKIFQCFEDSISPENLTYLERLEITTAKNKAATNKAKAIKSYAPTSPGSNPACKVSRSRAKEDLKDYLLERYGSNYSTVKSLLDIGMSDYDKLCRIRSNSVNDGILEDLTDRYYPHFSTIHSLYESNIKSYNELNR